MADLYEHFTGQAEPKISPHLFAGTMAEFARGKITGPQGLAILGLDATYSAQLGALNTRITGGFLSGAEVEQVLYLAEAGKTGYNTAALLKTRFGVT